MIRYYAYYSCGGYKDLYLGNNQMQTDTTYFVPLLPVWENRKNANDLKHISLLKGKTLIETVNEDNNHQFPNDGIIFFTHGGYKAIYRIFSDGTACLAIADIMSNDIDDFNRKTAFNMVITASGKEDIRKLDSMAYAYTRNFADFNVRLANLIGYDPIVNGIKFSLNGINSMVEESSEEYPGEMRHNKKVSYLFIENKNSLNIALKEQELDKNSIDCILDINGIFDGELPWEGLVSDHKMINSEKHNSEVSPEIDADANITDTKLIDNNINDNNSEVGHNQRENESKISTAEENLSKSNDSNATEQNQSSFQVIDTSEMMDMLQKMMENMSANITESFEKLSQRNMESMITHIDDNISKLLQYPSDTGKETADKIAEITSELKDLMDRQNSKAFDLKRVITYVVCVILGLLLGLLIGLSF